MLELRGAGYTLAETATRLGLSIAGVFDGCQKLGLALAERAEIDTPVTEKVPVSTPSAKPVTAFRRRIKRIAACAA